MCLELLLEAADVGAAGGPLMDLGTGSGVLAIAAAKLGWDPVAGCDHEEPALAAAAANARANGVGLAVERINLRAEPAPSGSRPSSRRPAPLLIEVADLLDPGRRPERMIVSGLLAGEADRVREAFARAGLRCEEVRESGDWAALRLAADRGGD